MTNGSWKNTLITVLLSVVGVLIMGAWANLISQIATERAERQVLQHTVDVNSQRISRLESELPNIRESNERIERRLDEHARETAPRVKQ